MKNVESISLFIPSFERGGVERNVILVSNLLLELGYKVEIIYARRREELFNSLDNNVKKTELRNRININFIHPRIIDALNISLPLYKYLKTNKEKKVIIAFQTSFVAVIIARILKIPVIVRVANNPSLVKFEKGITTKLSNYLKKYFYKFANVVITNSEKTAQDLERLIGRKVNCIYNPSYDKKLVDKAKEKITDDWFNNIEGKKIISVGRLTKQKDFATLIKAASIVFKEINCKLIIIGDGEEKENLKVLINKLQVSEKVEIIGFSENPYKYVANSDLFVLSSLYEGLPNVLIEAIGVGTPAVATDCLSGPCEILLSGEGGDLVPVGDEIEMAKKIVLNLTNYEYSKEKWRIAYKALYRFTKEEAKKKFQDLLNSI